VAAGGRRRIGPVDTIWLNMDRPNNLMVIVSVVFLESVPDWDEVLELIRTRIVERYPVFRQRRSADHGLFGEPYWEDDPHFDLARHVLRAALPEPGDDRELQRYIEEWVPEPLDPAHPLWEVHFLDGHGTGAALVLRAHHALADGIALTRVLLSVTEDDRGRTDADGGVLDVTVDATDDQEHSLLASVLTEGLDVARRGALLSARLATPSGVREALGLAVRTTRVVGDLLFAHNPDNPLGASPGVRKRVIWTQPLELDGLKRLGKLAGATLNDVLLAALAGALYAYQLDRGTVPVDLVTMVPVNVRPLDEPLPRELGNRFALIFFRFPSALASPLARLSETKKRMDWLKSSPEAVLTYGLITAIGRTSREVERHVVNFFANKAIGVTTNVAGPRTVRYLAGVPVTGVLGWVPGSGHHTVGFCVFTYAGHVRVGLLADETVVSEPELLLRFYEDEVRALIRMGAAA
jgi:WS/DGAT/MGAT family acyltransferase